MKPITVTVTVEITPAGPGKFRTTTERVVLVERLDERDDEDIARVVRRASYAIVPPPRRRVRA